MIGLPFQGKGGVQGKRWNQSRGKGQGVGQREWMGTRGRGGGRETQNSFRSSFSREVLFADAGRTKADGISQKVHAWSVDFGAGRKLGRQIAGGDGAGSQRHN